MSLSELLADASETNQGILYAVCLGMMGAIAKMWLDIRHLDREHSNCRVENATLKGELENFKLKLKEMRKELDALKVHQYTHITDEGAWFATDQMGRITLWSPDIVKMLGFKEEEMLGKPLFQIVPERFHQLHHEQLSAIVSGHTKFARHLVEKSYANTRAGMEIPVTTEVRSYRVYDPDDDETRWAFRITLEERPADGDSSAVVGIPQSTRQAVKRYGRDNPPDSSG